MALPAPKGRQTDVLAFPDKGHFVVLGTAGSGKTTLGILRASMLSKAFSSSKEKTLLVTFNKALVTYLESYAKNELKNVEVRNYHTFARGYLSNRKKLGNRQIVPNSNWEDKKLTLISQAKINILKKYPKEVSLHRLDSIFYEEIQWIQRMGIESLPQYEEINRTGRLGTRIIREKRKFFFEVYKEYLNMRKEAGYLYDWDDIAYFVREELKQDEAKRYYKHVIIDEGQDFSPIMLQSLAQAIPPDGSLTFFGDVAQQIYGQGLSWRFAGLHPLKVEEFKENHRNSKEIAEVALAISQSRYYEGAADMIAPISPKASGPQPALVKMKSPEEELEKIIQVAKRLYKNQTVAILVRTRQLVNELERRLLKDKIKTQILKKDMSSWSEEPGISIGTYHSAKGLEFNAVLMPFCSKDIIPSKERVEVLESEEEALIEEAKLIYVGVTRARRTLIVSYSNQLTELVPLNNKLFQVLEL